jgi:glyoxylase-like metal-dependent hydrolase (beta-lactamase superfamily II)
MAGHVTVPVAALADRLPEWVTLLRAPNPGPMTLDGTNTWLLRRPGADRAVVVDPGPLDEAHLARIVEHGPADAVLITHGHADHVEGAHRVAELLGGIDVLAADPTHRRGTGGWPTGGFVAGGVRIAVLPTPGHTADSVCFLAEVDRERVVLTGDTVLGRGTTVVAHPDGDLGAYLASLATLTAYQGVVALPGHGPALADCAAAAQFYLAHRRARLDQVRALVAEGVTDAPDLVARIYADVDRALWWAAEWSVRAQLSYLARQGALTGQDQDRPDRESAPGAGRLEPQ